MQGLYPYSITQTYFFNNMFNFYLTQEIGKISVRKSLKFLGTSYFLDKHEGDCYD